MNQGKYQKHYIAEMINARKSANVAQPDTKVFPVISTHSADRARCIMNATKKLIPKMIKTVKNQKSYRQCEIHDRENRTGTALCR